MGLLMYLIYYNSHVNIYVLLAKCIYLFIYFIYYMN